MEALKFTAGSVVSDIIEKVSFVNHLTRLSEATSENDAGTPGYLLDEITDLSFEPPPACQQLTDYLTRRLEKPSACVKLKVLNIMLRLLTSGHVSFRRALRRNDASLKMATMFHGQVDPLLGARHYEQVRAKAQDLLEKLYQPELLQADEDETVASPSERQKVMMGGLGSTGTAKGRYDGFGSSPRYKEESATERVSDMLDSLLNPADEAAAVVHAAFSGSVGDYSPACAATPAPAVDKVVHNVKRHTPGRAAGGWDSDSDEVQSPLSRLSTSSMEHIDALEAEDSAEKQMIAEFCECDVWPVTLADIRHTMEKCAGANCLQAVQYISAVLGTSSSKVRHLRALLLVECFLRKDLVPLALLAQLLSTPLDAMARAQGADEALRLKARKITLIIEKLSAE